MRRFSLGLLVLSFIIPALVQAEEEPSLVVEEIVIARNVVDLVPQDPGTDFPVDVERLFCFTRIRGAKDQTTITHVWFHGDDKMAEISLLISSPNFRTYSSKRILESWTGPWRVEVHDNSGNILSSAMFEIK